MSTARNADAPQQGSLIDVLKKKMRQAHEDAETAKDEAEEARKKLKEEKKKREEVSWPLSNT